MVKTGYSALVFAAFLFPVIAVFGPNLLVVLLIMAGLCPVILLFLKKQPLRLLNYPAMRWLLVLMGWMLASSLWSVAPEYSLILAAKFFLMLLLGYSIAWFLGTYPDTRLQSRLEKILIAGVIAAILLLVMELLTKGVISSHLHGARFAFDPIILNKGTTCVVLAIWVCLLALIRHRAFLFAIICTTGLGVALPFFESSAAILAYLAGGIAFAMLALFRRAGGKIVQAGCAVVLLVVPFLFLGIHAEKMSRSYAFLPESAKHRLYIWEYVSHKALAQPLLGHGADSARHYHVPPEDVKHSVFHPLPNHPHNGALQMWFELGMVGLLLFIASLLAFMQRMQDIPSRIAKAATFALITSYLVISLLSYNVWQSWWIAAGLLQAVFLRNSILLMPSLLQPAPVRRTPQPTTPQAAASGQSPHAPG